MRAPPTLVAPSTATTVAGHRRRSGPTSTGRGAHVATASFMVDPAHAGKGVGRALGDGTCSTRARADGYRAMQFNAVVETNTGAVRLWRSLGFAIARRRCRRRSDHPTRGYVGLHVMWRSLEG